MHRRLLEVVNAIRHGKKYDASKRAGSRLGAEGTDLVITVTDQGSGFDLASVADPLASENPLKRAGRGIVLIRAFMDEGEVRRLFPTGAKCQ